MRIAGDEFCTGRELLVHSENIEFNRGMACFGHVF